MTLNDDVQGENTLTLFPPKILLATQNVVSDPAPPPGVPVVGLPLGIFKDLSDDNTGANALKVLVDPPPPTPDTTISLWINGARSGLPQDVGNEVIEFIVFQTEFRDGIINVIQDKLETKEGNKSESTELWTLYSANRPGGNAPTGTGPHPQLQIRLPAPLGDPAEIGKTEVDKGVLLTCSYTHGKAYDLITYEINRKRYSHRVLPTETGKDISILIDRATFEQIGSLNDCPFSYTVDDQLRNGTHNERWSKYIYANIDLERVFLPMPLLREKAADSTDDPKIVDLKKLDGNPLLVVVLPNDTLYQEDDWVKAYYRLDDSPEEATEAAGFTVDDFGALNPCIVYIPNEKLVSGKSLHVRFQLERPKDKVIGTSRIATAEIIGEAVPDLAAPAIEQAPGASLDPFAAKDKLIAVVDYDGMELKDVIEVTWTAGVGVPPGGSHTSLPHIVEVIGPQKIALANSVVAFNIGLRVEVTYDKKTGSALRGSLPLRLTVQDIPDERPELPKPYIDRVTGDELDPEDLLESDYTRIPPWPLIAAGQKVWLSYKEIKPDGTNGIIIKAFEGKELTSEDLDEIKHSTPIKLKELPNNSTLEISTEVTFDGSMIADRKLAFPKKNYRVRTKYDDLTDFNNYHMNNWQKFVEQGTVIHKDEEYFLQSVSNGTEAHFIIIYKSYQHLNPGEHCILTFDYRASSNTSFSIFLGDYTPPNYIQLPRQTLQSTSRWKNTTSSFYLGAPDSSIFSVLWLHFQASSSLSIDNLRLKTVSKTRSQH